jgi:hypothetical protein
MLQNRSSDVREGQGWPGEGGGQLGVGPQQLLPGLGWSGQDGSWLNEDEDQLDKTSGDLPLNKELDMMSPEGTGLLDAISTLTSICQTSLQMKLMIF